MISAYIMDIAVIAEIAEIVDIKCKRGTKRKYSVAFK